MSPEKPIVAVPAKYAQERCYRTEHLLVAYEAALQEWPQAGEP
jgi:hypothetical protein